MKKELISKATRNEFREVLVSFFVLREIDTIFEAAGLTPRNDFVPAVTGERRTRVEQYYANVNFYSPSHVRKLVAAFDELMLQLSLQHSRWTGTKREEAIGKLSLRMQWEGFHLKGGRFISDALRADSLETPSLIALTEESIAEHIEKARAKIAADDPAGAITNAYTLVEQFLREILSRTGTAFKGTEGDIRALYSQASDVLGLNPKGDHLESHLRTILQGLKGSVTGLYEVANKASDRHARKYNPAPHHAKLAVNASLTLCEFLLDSFTYQREKKGQVTKP